MNSSGLLAKGFSYLQIDDCWEEMQRNPETNELQGHKVKFPSGMKAIGDYIHSKGLKFGIYSDSGYYTCQKKPGSLNFEELDAETFAKWGVDLLKFDNCFSTLEHPKFRYARMRDALNHTGRPILFMMCE